MNHIALVHAHEPGFNITCGLNGCSKTFKKYDSYRKHVQRKHRDVVPPARIIPPSRTEDNSAGPNENGTEPTSSDTDAGSSTPNSTRQETDDPTTYMSEMLNNMKRHLVLFSLKVTENHLLPQSVCDDIFKDVRVLLELLLDSCRTYFNLLVSSGRLTVSSDNGMLSLLSSDMIDILWDVIRSDHTRLKYVQEHFPFVPPKEINLHENIHGRSRRHVFYYVPIQDMLRNLMTADIGSHILARQQEDRIWNIHNQVLTDVCDGSYVKSHALIEDGSAGTLLLLLYTDELEVVNPLGGACGKHKLLVVYMNLLNLHPKCRSRLKTINLVLVVKYPLVMQYGLQKIMDPMVADLNALQTDGIDITLNGSALHFKVYVVGFSGDNLSLNRLGGFTCGFSAGRICRYCLANARDMPSLTEEARCSVRSAEGHMSHIAAVELSPDNVKLYGVKERSCLLSLNGFDVTRQLLPDLMHDVLEGGINVVIKAVLNSLLASKTLLRAHFSAVSQFQFKHHDIKNRPLPIVLTNSDKVQNIKGTASQKLCLFRLLPQFFADRIPEGNPDWEIYLQYREIVNVLLSDKIPVDCVNYLEVQIGSFLRAFVERYPEVKVTPKIHYLIHYPRYISLFGPPRNFWSMRFEAKHARVKTIAVRARSFVNTAKTIATRVQLGQCYNAICSNVRDPLEVPVAKAVLWEDLPDLVTDAFVPQPSHQEVIFETRSAAIDFSVYNEGDIFCTGWEDEAPVFGQIIKLIIFRGSLLMFFKLLHTCGFSRHRQAYQVVHTSRCVQASPGDEHSYHPLDLYKYKNHNEVIPQFELFEV
ncbi:uncharacterized protein LOC135366472 [Ornithodoros turicata]|uniref:uncharacterized protein LOC135366472 n=1 Tax=Ornithodoros turicata TaxID=34597 RepID=UPI00313A4D23